MTKCALTMQRRAANKINRNFHPVGAQRWGGELRPVGKKTFPINFPEVFPESLIKDFIARQRMMQTRRYRRINRSAFNLPPVYLSPDSFKRSQCGKGEAVGEERLERGGGNKYRVDLTKCKVIYARTRPCTNCGKRAHF